MPADDPQATLAAPAEAWLAYNAGAFAVRAGADVLVTARRAVAGWRELAADERADVLALLDEIGVDAGAVRFELAAPAGERWHLRVTPTGGFAALPGFVAGEEQHLLPALRRALVDADAADLLAAFVQPSGVALLREDLEDALRRGARVRVLTGDYLGITAPAALRELHELSVDHPGLAVRVHCSGGASFHPKAYIFRRGDEAVAYVGSSNLSASALLRGVEWNLRALYGAHGPELASIRARFDRLWHAPATVELTPAWIDAYAARAPVASGWDEPLARPQPHAIQREALANLAAALAGGARRGLVVLATGLGKTLLAAFAAERMAARRVLFVAHREEILTQARRAFGRVLPDRSSGLFMAERRDVDADLVFATVQTLARPEHLETWPDDRFDLVVVDEFHHAAALGYRRLLARFAPRFLLGLTATPERADGAALLSLCDDRLIHRAGVVEGVARGRLVPFAYHGLLDELDYQAIPWRSGRFDPDALSRALATRAHAEQALAGYRRHAGGGPRRGLWFCASIAHAEFMAAFLRERGIAAAAVHSGPGGAPRADSLRRLAAGELEALTTVDVFNEGVDAPDVDVVVLLRPTESRVVFLQQIGRGLRLPESSGKRRLEILDFIGNHRSFLAKPQALLALLGESTSGSAAQRRIRDGDLPLPPGCSVEIETAALDLLARLTHAHRGDAVVLAFMRLRDDLGRRPTLSEFGAADMRVSAVAQEYGSWWRLLARLDELGADEARVLAARGEELTALETAGEPSAGPWRALRRWVELGGVGGSVETTAPADDPARLWPEALVRRGGALALRRPVAVDEQPVLEAMIAEVAAAREAGAARGAAREAEAGELHLRVSHNDRHAILRYAPDPALPTGDTEVWVDGDPYIFNFVKIAVNTARTRPGGPNLLGAVLRGLFGETAGASGTEQWVVLRREGDRWTLGPSTGRPREDAVRLPFYGELAAACGPGDIQHGARDERRLITVPAFTGADPRRHFVVRASGDSMAGGATPIRDGDLVLCARLLVDDPRLVEGKACLLVADLGPDASVATIKAPVRSGGAWVLRSWSEGQADLPVRAWEELRVVGRVIGVVQAVE